jgi:sphingomyelin phosphodiesterase
MNYCNNQNWWLLFNSTDPEDELMWFINELQYSELINEKVHVIGHIPPGSNDCLEMWSRNYHRIINRFEKTITGQFFGHTHQDEFEIFYSDDEAEDQNFEDLKPVSVAYIGPSTTTFGGVNPGYRIYEIGGTHFSKPFSVINHQTYFANLTEANYYGPTRPLEWKQSYSALEAFDFKSLEAQEWHQLIIDMMSDEKLFNQFLNYFYNRSNFVKSSDCSDVCKNEILCRLISAKAHNNSYCNKLLKLLT